MTNPTSDKQIHYIAIDPGKDGGIVCTSNAGVEMFRMPPTLHDRNNLLISILAQQEFGSRLNVEVRAYIEAVPTFVRVIPSSSALKLGRSYGQLEGMLAANHVRLFHVTPQAWQKANGVGTSKGLTSTAWKNKLKERAQNLYPDHKVTLCTADAALILWAATQGKI